MGPTEIRRRNRNQVWGLVLSVLLAALVSLENQRDPETYNAVLLWSVLGFLLIANLVNLFRHIRYVRLIKDHRLEVTDTGLVFITGTVRSELDLNDLVLMNVYRGRHGIRHLQLRLKSGRGIRLEGYDRLEALADSIADRLQAHQVLDKGA